MKLSLIIEAINKASRPIDAARRSVGGLDREGRRAASGGLASVDRAIDRARRTAGGLERAGYRIGYGIGAGTRRAIAGLAALDRRLVLTERQAWAVGKRVGGFVGGGLRAGAAIATGGVLAAAYKVLTTGLQFERFRTQLTGLEGSQAAGDRAMAWVTDFARKTPYELDQVMSAFVALKAYGIDPANGSLRTLGDTAAGMGKGLMQAVEMIADAQTGEFERLKEFGVRASKQGERTTFTFRKNGQEIKRIARSTAEIMPTLMAIFNERFAGGMDRLAQTTEGKWSNLMDRLTVTANRIWTGGLSASINREMDRISAAIDQAESDGSLKRWAEDTSRGVAHFVSEMGRMDWAGLAGDLRDVAGAFRSLAGSIRYLTDTNSDVAQFLNGARNLWGLGDSLGSVGWGKQGGLVYVPPGQRKLKPTSFGTVGATPARKAPEKPAPSGVPFIDGRIPQRPSPSPPKAQVDLNIRTAPGTRAQPARISANGIDLNVRTGRAMQGDV